MQADPGGLGEGEGVVLMAGILDVVAAGETLAVAGGIAVRTLPSTRLWARHRMQVERHTGLPC
jgi:hypothetical protein